MDYHGWLELRRIAIDLDDDDQVKVVVFTGAGDRAFSAGADIKDFESEDFQEGRTAFIERRNPQFKGR